MVAEALHAQRRNAFAVEHRQHFVGEAAEVRVHDIERHLHGVEVEAVLARFVEHAQVDVADPCVR